MLQHSTDAARPQDALRPPVAPRPPNASAKFFRRSTLLYYFNWLGEIKAA